MSYRRDFSIYRKEEVLCQLKIRGAIEKFQQKYIKTRKNIIKVQLNNLNSHYWLINTES